MIDPLATTLSLLAGLLLGGFYFGGLWWTLRRMTRSPRPLRWYFGGLLFRLAVLFAALYAVLLGAGPAGLAACLIGIVAARIAMVRWAGKPPAIESTVEKA